MTLTASERETLQAANRIKRSLNRERRRNVLAQRPHEKAHRGRERDNGFLAFLRRQPCEAHHMGNCSGPIEAAHIRYNDGPERQNPGGARKNHDKHANALCSHHHREQHDNNERNWWQSIGKDAYETAAQRYAEYRVQA